MKVTGHQSHLFPVLLGETCGRLMQLASPPVECKVEVVDEQHDLDDIDQLPITSLISN